MKIHLIQIQGGPRNDLQPFLEKPSGYQVVYRAQPGAAANEIIQKVVELGPTFLVILREIGMTEWVRTKAYDTLFDYIKNYLKVMPASEPSNLASKISVRITGSKTTVDLNFDNVAKAKIDLKILIDGEEAKVKGTIKTK